MNHTARTTRTASEDLRVVVEHWEHLRSLLDSATPDVWPPLRPGAEYLRTLDEHDAAEVAAGRHGQQLVTTRHESGQLYYACAHCDRVGEGHEHPVRDDRGPGQLAELPAPLRLHVADAIRTVEFVLASLADEIAGDVQRAAVAAPRRPGTGDTIADSLVLIAAVDAADPQRWHYTMGDRSAPRAAQWLLDRLADRPGPCRSINDAHRERITRIAREAARRVERTIGADRRSVELTRPCPWCGGALIMHTGSDVDTVVSCATGLVDCSAPASFNVDMRRREWGTPEQLAALYVALDAAEKRKVEADRRAQRAEARRRQRAAARGNAAA
ncbi:hypothetical protein [Streptomyces niveus]|uniref:hypothetical protein n=1 Tax=Streptomyces niveus TaxID=193462 RepID=UPI0003C60451|nr:hypothetical protein [Streptomyces niveus]EST22797.1 hypothetical protein M877_28890 [Streptomyces niveus NCIMB 11891]